MEEINFSGDLAVDPLVHAPVNGAFLASATLRAVRQGASGMLVYKGARDPSGRSPRGEPDFGLWSSALSDTPAPAFGVLQLMRRFVAGSGRLARVDVHGVDLDALVVDTEQGPRTAVVNLSPTPRSLRIAGLAPAPVATLSGDVPWTSAWFDGSLRELPALPTVRRGRQTYHARCASCHGDTPGGAHAPGLAGRTRSTIDTSHVAPFLTRRERVDLAHYLSGWRTGGRVVTGTVADQTGAPISGALVISAGADAGRAAWTNDDGHFQITAVDALSSATAAPIRLIALHPDHGAADAPTGHRAEPAGRSVTFVLNSPPTHARPLLASSFSVDDGAGVLRLGTGSAGAIAEVCAATTGGAAR